MPEKGFGVRFRRYHSTLDDFTDEKIENSVVRKRRKELKFSDIELYPGNLVRYSHPACPECGSEDVSWNGTYPRKLENGTVLRIQRYICKRCDKKFMARLPGYGYHKHISEGVKEKGVKARVKSTLRKASWFIQTLLDSFISHETIRKLIPKRDENAPLDTSLHFTYDEQYVNINGIRKYRALLKDNHTHRFVEDVMENLLDESIVPFLTVALKRFSVQPGQTVCITADCKCRSRIFHFRRNNLFQSYLIPSFAHSSFFAENNPDFLFSFNLYDSPFMFMTEQWWSILSRTADDIVSSPSISDHSEKRLFDV